MRKLLILLALAFTSLMASAQLNVQNALLGSGNDEVLTTKSFEVYNDIFHVPQYMPGFPTAATIWPRIVKTKCNWTGNSMYCDAIRHSEYGYRTEYLYFTEAAKNLTDIKVDVLLIKVDKLAKDQKKLEELVSNQKPVTIFIEVPVKKNNQ